MGHICLIRQLSDMLLRKPLATHSWIFHFFASRPQFLLTPLTDPDPQDGDHETPDPAPVIRRRSREPGSRHLGVRVQEPKADV